MSIKEKLRENASALFARMIPAMTDEYRTFARGNARCGNSEDPERRLTDILMLTHALEKAFSLPSPRPSFGRAKALRLCSLIEGYIADFGFGDALRVPVSLVAAYIAYHQENGVDDDDLRRIRVCFDSFVKASGHPAGYFDAAGWISMTAGDMAGAAGCSFRELVALRHSVRDFGPDPIADMRIREALSIAAGSPSACNRQAWRAHVFRGDKKVRLLEMQGGASGFADRADAAIMICADMRRYYTREVHLGYVDASLFAMSLIYALTAAGVATVPLTLAIDRKIISRIHTDFDIPSWEIPVILIAAGSYPPEFRVCMSQRDTADSFTTFHE